jgi:uncharacterized lipoprotein YddW (UPF0748 family)
MKKAVILLLSLIITLCSCSNEDIELSVVSDFPQSEADVNFSENETSVDNSEEILNTEGENFMKAVWISQFDMSSILKENGNQREEESFKGLYRTVLNNIKNDGYNTVIVQVRPYADSFYPSKYFPTSNYVNGDFYSELRYDPFEVIVSLAKEIGLSVHAWLNPMRAMKSKEIINVPDRYIIKEWYNDPERNGKYIVEVDGRYYLNPAYEEVRALIANGAKEVAELYDIDGVHIDDYFYPIKDEYFDAAAYTEYKNSGGSKPLSKFRNEMLDLMVSGIYNAVKSVGKDQLFGISPAGNIENTYNDLYTDVYKWCSEEGFIDYICPQIYFGLEHQTHDFVKVYNIWNSIIRNDNIMIYVGLTLGKAKSGIDNYAGVGKNEWTENKDVIKRCLEYINTRKECAGVVVFCYQHMYDPVTGESVKETAQERVNMKTALNDLS